AGGLRGAARVGAAQPRARPARDDAVGRHRRRRARRERRGGPPRRPGGAPPGPTPPGGRGPRGVNSSGPGFAAPPPTGPARLAVADLDAAIELHTSTYGMPLVHRETVSEQGVEAALLDVGESHVELLAPLAEDTPVGRFLAARGPGLHHVAYRVDDVSAALQQ